jgi:hypothetical protein
MGSLLPKRDREGYKKATSKVETRYKKATQNSLTTVNQHFRKNKQIKHNFPIRYNANTKADKRSPDSSCSFLWRR